jgi:hypothetical protein
MVYAPLLLFAERFQTFSNLPSRRESRGPEAALADASQGVRKPVRWRWPLIGARAARAPSLLLVAFAACGDFGPLDARLADDEGGPGDVQRVTLTVTAEVDAADAEIADALGFEGGAVPGAMVTIRRVASGEEDSLQTDNSGRAVFERILPGTYQISGLRLLTDAERERLTGSDAEVNAFGGGTAMDVAGAAAAGSVALAAGRPGSLVVSEVWFGSFIVPGVGAYVWGFYLELYNNSDTTIYVDGKVIGRALTGAWDYDNEPCPIYDHLKGPDGIWAFYLYRFPGSGRDYPVLPGRTVLIAAEAVDHGAMSEGQFDLRSADFEFESTAGVDNPQVPNLTSIGPRTCCLGRGLRFHSLDGVVIIADSLDETTLLQGRTVFDTPIVRVPGEKVLDVLAYRSASQAVSFAPCERIVNERFDRQWARLLDGNDRRSIQRRPLLALPDGRVVLQRTKTSARDFMAALPTPGTLPPSGR